MSFPLHDIISRKCFFMASHVWFSQASVQLPSNAKYDPYCPRMNPDSQTVTAYHSSAASVKELLDKVLGVPAENRTSLLAGVCVCVFSHKHEFVYYQYHILLMSPTINNIFCMFLQISRRF